MPRDDESRTSEIPASARRFSWREGVPVVALVLASMLVVYALV